MSDLGGILAGGGGEEESGLEIELEGPDIPVSGSSAPPTPGTPPGFYGWVMEGLNFELLTEEINNCFKYGDSLTERENLGVEEYATLMFDYFERMSTDINPDFISGIEVKIDSLTTLELEELYFTTFGLEIEIIEDTQMEEEEVDTVDSQAAALNRTFTAETAAAMDALAASVTERESGSEMESENEDEVEMEIENQFGGFGGGKNKSKKTKRKSNKKSKKRNKNKKKKRKNTKRKSNKKNTKRKSNKKNTKSK